MPACNAVDISISVLPTPEKTTFLGSPPAWMTSHNSPTVTISKPEPKRAIRFNTPKFEFALTA